MPSSPQSALYDVARNFMAEASSSAENNRTQPLLAVPLAQDGDYLIVVRGARHGNGGAHFLAERDHARALDATPTRAPINFLPFEEVQRVVIDGFRDGGISEWALHAARSHRALRDASDT
jgi:hypothetical protein